MRSFRKDQSGQLVMGIIAAMILLTIFGLCYWVAMFIINGFALWFYTVSPSVQATMIMNQAIFATVASGFIFIIGILGYLFVLARRKEAVDVYF